MLFLLQIYSSLHYWEDIWTSLCFLFSNFILLGKCCFHLKDGYIALLWRTRAIVLTQHKGRVFKHAQRMFISGCVLFGIQISGSKEF